MRKYRSTVRAMLIVVTAFTCASLARAQATRTWVSGVGDDVNPCSRTAPCKTFAGAIAKTIAGGEIDALDPGGFGTVVISKSITIDGTGTLASILGSGSPAGIIINIRDVPPVKEEKPDTAKSVRIRGLSINGAGTGVNGIRVMAANTVTVEDTVIDGFSGNGISVEATGATQVFVTNTTIRNNAGSGINVLAGKGQVAISDVRLVFNGSSLTDPGGSISSFKNNAIYGNKKDPASPVALR